jgi:hypothetical protein
MINLPNGLNKDSWILANIKHAGWYRVNYNQENWELLITQLNVNHQLIDVISRAQLLDDSFNLGRAEILDQLTFLEISEYLSNEEDPLPFVPAFAGLDFIGNLLSNDYETFQLYKKFYIGLIDSTYNRLGWDEQIDNVTTLSLQLSTLSVMCNYGKEDCVQKAKGYYNEWLNDDKP